MAVIRLEGVVQHYKWGSRTAIADLLGRKASGSPEAELWFGVHPKGPARLLTRGPGGEEFLADLIQSDPVRYLGASCQERFGRMPFLFKVLAADRPLSLQTHPDLSQAEAGFDREEAAGIPVDARERNYRDRWHKPELLLALTPFEALCGFRDPRDCLRVLSSFGVGQPGTPLAQKFARFYNAGDTTALRTFFESLFRLEEAELKEVIDRIVRRAQRLMGGPETAAASWVCRMAGEYGNDPGVIASLLLRHLHLEPFEGIYLPAREIHAYLSGTGIELMASSDNVLRAGLTGKHVDPDELCRVTSFQPKAPDVPHVVKRRTKKGADVVTYVTPPAEFELTHVGLDGGEFVIDGPAIAVVLEGDLEATTLGQAESCQHGDAFFVSADGPVRVNGRCRLALATLHPTA